MKCVECGQELLKHFDHQLEMVISVCPDEQCRHYVTEGDGTKASVREGRLSESFHNNLVGYLVYG